MGPASSWWHLCLSWSFLWSMQQAKCARELTPPRGNLTEWWWKWVDQYTSSLAPWVDNPEACALPALSSRIELQLPAEVISRWHTLDCSPFFLGSPLHPPPRISWEHLSNNQLALKALLWSVLLGVLRLRQTRKQWSVSEKVREPWRRRAQGGESTERLCVCPGLCIWDQCAQIFTLFYFLKFEWYFIKYIYQILFQHVVNILKTITRKKILNTRFSSSSWSAFYAPEYLAQCPVPLGTFSQRNFRKQWHCNLFFLTGLKSYAR